MEKPIKSATKKKVGTRNIRISMAAYEKLRVLAFKERKTIIKIINERLGV